MARLTSLTLPEARELGARFGVEIAEIEALDAGSVNSNFRVTCADGERLFGRIYEEQGAEGAVAEMRLLKALSRLGVPTGEPVALLVEGALPSVAGKPFALYRWVQGESLCTLQVTPERANALGETLARVHLATPALGALPQGRFGSADLTRRLDAIARDTGEYDEAVALVREKLAHYTARRDASLPRGLIHGDLFRDNALWRDDALVAVLDFESASEGAFVYDLMVCLLAWCYGDGFRVDVAQALLAGYEQRRPLSAAEIDALGVEGAIACLRFATTRIRDFSLRCAPGERPARDYRRFLQRLADLENAALNSILGSRTA